MESDIYELEFQNNLNILDQSQEDEFETYNYKIVEDLRNCVIKSIHMFPWEKKSINKMMQEERTKA